MQANSALKFFDDLKLPKSNSSSNETLTPEAWLKGFIDENELRYDYKTNSVQKNGETIESGYALAQMRLSAFNNNASEIKGHISDAFIVWKKEQEKLVLTQMRELVTYQPCDKDWVGIWIEASTGGRSPLDMAVLRHFIWQVKRKLFNKPVEYHLCPILVGKSGVGKSVAVHQLLKPMETLCLSTGMSVFADSFSKRQFLRNFIMFFDELQNCHEVDVNTLKHIITAPKIDWRVMRSESVFSGKQNSTFIGCSNEPVRDRIHDTTSARRFWQLNCDKVEWNVINNIDYLALWRSVDENGECPLLPYLDEIKKVQDSEIRSKDTIEQWLDSSCEAFDFDSQSPTTAELYRHFKIWCIQDSVKISTGLQEFSRGLPHRIKSLNWSSTSKRSNRGTIWSLKLKQCQLP